MVISAINLIKTLVLMQLKDKTNLDFIKSKKSTISTVVFTILKFAAVVFFAYVLLYASLFLNIFNINKFIPASVITVAFTSMLFLSVVFCTFNLMNSLYFSKDNFILLSLPVSTNKIFLSKIIVAFVYELKRNISYLLSLFIAYGLITNYPVYYYLWATFAVVIISLFSVALSGLLSIPAMFISNFLKRNLYIQIVLAFTFSASAFFGIFKLISLIPENINLIGSWGKFFWSMQDFLASFRDIFWPIHRLTKMIIGTRIAANVVQYFTMDGFITLVYLILTIILTMSMTILLVKPFFFKMASKPFEYKKKTKLKDGKNLKTPALLASVKKEILLIVRSPKNIIRVALIFSILPVAIYLSNTIYAAMNTRLLGQYMVFSFNLLIMLLITTAFNIRMASVYSREGSASYLMKTSPGKELVFVFSKIIIESIVVISSIILTFIVLQQVNPMPIINLVLFLVAVIFVYLSHLLISAEMDIMRPQTQQYTKNEESENNPNETSSAIYSVILSALFFAIALFLFMEGVFAGWLKVGLLALAFLIFRLYLFINKVKVYYKERI